MTWWVTVAAVRIHSWIQQTPQLSHMRGASLALSRRTAPKTVGTLGFADVKIQDRESKVDGVVVATAPDAEVAAAYARALIGHLADAIPGVQWESWWCDADSYVAAFTRSVNGFDAGVNRLTRHPALLEAGPVMSCLMCRSEPAARAGSALQGVVGDDDDQAIDSQGVGCQVRHEEGAVNKAALPSDDLRLQIGGRRLAKDFAELASSGGTTTGSSGGALGRKESRNHLATVYADGNGMGAFFQVLSSSSLTLTNLQERAISALNEATKNAVAEAAWMIAPDPDIAAIEPHFVGGDDVLVSVPAPYAWTFVAYLAGFFEGLRDTLSGLLTMDLDEAGVPKNDPQAEKLQARIDAISLGVGMTFAHASYPFAEAEAAAGIGLKQAKNHAKGQYSAIGWVDVTAQFAARGHQAAYVLSAQQARDELDIPAEDETATAVFRLSPSARSQLAATLRDEPEATLYKAVADWASRLEDEELGKALVELGRAQKEWALLGPEDRARKTPEALWARAVWADLSRARWWPNVNRKVER